jgi:nucleolin
LGFRFFSALHFVKLARSLELSFAMAAATMSMAVASTRFAAVFNCSTNLSCNGGALSMAAPASSSSMSCAFTSFSVSNPSSANAAIIARAAEVSEYTFGEAETKEETPAVQQGSKLYVGNLPWSCDSAKLAEICQDTGGTVEEVQVIYDQLSGRSRGFAFVTMASQADAQMVIDALNGTDMGGRALTVNYPQPKGDRPRFERGERPERSAPAGGNSRRADDPNKLFVGNLSWGCDEGALHQLFSDFGKVVDATIVYDRDSGRSRGFGFVTLENTSEVNAAIQNLDGADFEGRQLRVNMAGDKPPARF